MRSWRDDGPGLAGVEGAREEGEEEGRKEKKNDKDRRHVVIVVA